MKQYEMHPWVIHYDDKLTKNIYSKIEKGGPETCGCEHCLNFIANRDQLYPNTVKEIFNILGIDYTKEEEVYHYARMKNGLHSYGGDILFVGTIEYLDDDFKPGEQKKTIEMKAVDENFSWNIVPVSCTVPDIFKGHPLAEVTFHAEIPWVIKEKEPK